MSNKLLATLLLLITFVGLATAGIIARPTKTTGGTSYSDGTIPHASDYNGDADTIYTLVNGALDNSNIAVGAAIAGSKITPNFTANVQVTTGAVPCFVNIDSSLGSNLKQWRICQSAGVLSIATYTDAGAVIITPLSIARATGIITLAGGFVVSSGNLTVTSLAAKSFLFSGVGGLLSTTSAPTNGQMLIGNTGNNPTVGTIAGTATHICTTLGAGTFTLDFCANPDLASPVISGTPTINLLDTKGDIIAATADNTPAKLAAGSNGTVLIARSQASTGLAYVAALNKVIYGLTYSNNAGDATNDLDIASGGAMDITGAYFMVGSALTKQTDVSWVVGNNAGCLDTGVVGNNDYFLWKIVRSDTGVVDDLCSLSSTAPTMPGSYDFKRLYGWYKRSAGAILPFSTYELSGGGLEFKWTTGIRDVNAINALTTSRRLDSLSVPLNFSTIARISAIADDATAGTFITIRNPDEADAAPNVSGTPGATFRVVSSISGGFPYEGNVRTSATGQIASRATLATVDSYFVITLGFDWARRN